MIVFILADLLLAFLVVTKNEILGLLVTPVALGISLTLMLGFLLLGYLKKVPSMIWHDGFATTVLLVWYGYWQPQFNDDPPMFLFFPLYYALFTSIVTLALINKSPYFDQESIDYLRYLEKLTRFDIKAAIGFVLVSLLITQHYALFPMAMTFFIIRHAMVVCLETVEQ